MTMKSYAQVAKEVIKELYLNGNGRNISNIPERRQHWIERCCWIIICGLFLGYCGVSIYDKYLIWHQNPVQYQKHENIPPYSSIPFPSLTICPRNKVSKSVLDLLSIYKKLRHTNDSLTDFERPRVEALSHICNFRSLIENKLERIPLNDSIYRLIYEMAPALNETLDYCYWRDQYLPCADNFQPIFTDVGLCFTFNELSPRNYYTDEIASDMVLQSNVPNISHWSRDTGYSMDDRYAVYPRRMFNSDLIGGLHVSMRLIKQDMDFPCIDPVYGFDVIISSPGETSKRKRHGFRIPPGEEATLSIRPMYFSISTEALQFEPEKRRCFYGQERQLRFFKFYTRRNCEAECLANYTQFKCGCVKFSMPRDPSTKVCDAKSIKCYQNAEIDIFGDVFVDRLADNHAKSFRQQCNCIHACTEFHYGFDIDRAKLMNSSVSGYHFSKDIPGKYLYSNLVVNFGTVYIENMELRPIYTMTDLLSTIGGLLGLFLGLSAFSILHYIVNFVFNFCHLVKHLRSKSIVTPHQRAAPGDKDFKIVTNLKESQIRRKYSAPDFLF